MKNVRLMVLATITMLFMGMANLNAQETHPQTVIIRVYEEYRTNSHIAVVSPDGSIKSIEIKNMKPGSFNESDNNLSIVQAEINSWKKQGFKVDGISTTAITALITTIILSKEE